jgi:chorismate mutase / prephenate dehydratase
MTGPDTSLADIRTEIDAIDDGIVDLLVRRAAAQRKVKARKASDGSLAVSPVRPAREAEILRRIVKRGGADVDPELLVRLWRNILVASALSQAPVNVYVARRTLNTSGLAAVLASHFGPMPLVASDGDDDAVAACAAAPGDLCVVETAGPWANSFAQGRNGNARVLGVLPVLACQGVPPLLLIGHAEAQQSGNDCTLLLSHHRAGGGLWSCTSGESTVICLSGFLGPAEVAAAGYESSSVAGRFPAQIKVEKT